MLVGNDYLWSLGYKLNHVDFGQNSIRSAPPRILGNDRFAFLKQTVSYSGTGVLGIFIIFIDHLINYKRANSQPLQATMNFSHGNRLVGVFWKTSELQQ